MPENAVLITGATGGIGAATAAMFAGHGYRVYAGVRKGSGHPALDRTGIRPVELDVTDPASIDAACREIAEEQPGGLNVLINNAGVIVQGPLELLSPEELHRQFAVNVYGPALVMRAFLPLLRTGNGRVINISAPTARVAMPFLGVLGASKAALENLSDAVRIELAPWNIPVVVVEPGAMDTDIFGKADSAAQDALANARPESVALYQNQLVAMGKAIEKQRLGNVETVAKVVLRSAQARRPKNLYTAGSDARMMGLLSRFPAGLRDRMIVSTLGLK